MATNNEIRTATINEYKILIRTYIRAEEYFLAEYYENLLTELLQN